MKEFRYQINFEPPVFLSMGLNFTSLQTPFGFRRADCMAAPAYRLRLWPRSILLSCLSPVVGSEPQSEEAS